jgi:hypothetical protein
MAKALLASQKNQRLFALLSTVLDKSMVVCHETEEAGNIDSKSDGSGAQGVVWGITYVFLGLWVLLMEVRVGTLLGTLGKAKQQNWTHTRVGGNSRECIDGCCCQF